MCRIDPGAAGGRNVCAFLDMIAWSEGTDNGRQPTKDHGYDVLVGGGIFTGYADHPRRLVEIPKLGIRSTAAGRYQLLSKYYDAYRLRLRLQDFSPLSQDLIAIQQLREQKALMPIADGDVAGAIARCRSIWASLPGAGYGQHEHKLGSLQLAYAVAGGRLA